MKLATVYDMREMDRKTIQKMSSKQLMMNAAASVYEVLQERVMKHKKILVLCGTGNNGGDGYALALLANEDYQVQLLPLDDPRSEDACYYYQKAKEAGISFLSKWPDHTSYDVVIDALFGTGLCREISGKAKDLMKAVNASSAIKISIDIPSGVQGDSGEVLGCAVFADIVISFQYAKRGLYFYPGYLYGKEIIVKDIGIAKEDQLLAQPIEILDEQLITSSLPKRIAHSHKGTYGKVLMIGGSSSMHGAITMAADSALHSGLGTLTLLIPDVIREIVSAKLLEAMIISAPSKDGFFAKETVAILQKMIANYDLIVIGCGMGRSEVSEELVHCVLTSKIPCVIDADGLYVLGKQCSYLKREAPIILTPHPKEFQYLSHIDSKDIVKAPVASAMTFLKDYPSVTLVLKDERTLIFHQQQIFLNIRGNNALAKGGSGDVLCGIISGLFAQSKEPLQAAYCGVFLHALCGEYLAQTHSYYTILPHHLYEVLDQVLLTLTSQKR